MTRKVLVTGGSGFIGTHLIEKLRTDTDYVFMNLDKAAPKITEHNVYWRRVDLLNHKGLEKVFLDFNPTDVVHLAARTDTESDKLEDYIDNTVGTENLLRCVQESLSVKRLIITSSQFVCAPGYSAKNDEDFSPHTAYGQSKVINEQQTRALDLQCVWSIIRPTNIWGPWHPRYPYEFWKVLRNRTYFHPSGITPIRAYGYVKNVVNQIFGILHKEEDLVNQQVFYVGDPPVRLIEWVDGFSIALTGKRARIVPRFFVRSLALAGDFLSLINIKFPIHTSRFRSMTTDYPVPMELTFNVLGHPDYSLEEGIKETAQWLKANGFVEEVYV